MRYLFIGSVCLASIGTVTHVFLACMSVTGSGYYVPRGVYQSGAVYRSIRRIGRPAPSDTGLFKSLQLCFLSYVNIHPSSSTQALTRGCNVSLYDLDTGDSTSSGEREWRLDVIGPGNDRSVTCSVLCICKVDKRSTLGKQQPWCIPSNANAVPRSNSTVAAGVIDRRMQRKKTVPDGYVLTPGDRVETVVMTFVVLGFLYLLYRRMRSLFTASVRGGRREANKMTPRTTPTMWIQQQTSHDVTLSPKTRSIACIHIRLNNALFHQL